MKDITFNFDVTTIRNNPWGSKVTRILNAALNSVEPSNALTHYVHRDGHLLVLSDRIYPLDEFERIFLIGFGKASTPMAYSMAKILGDQLSRGIVITKEGYRNSEIFSITQLQIFEAGHPIPDERGLEATRKVQDLLSTTSASDLVFCLISGGGSALLTNPATGLTLAEIQDMTNLLLECGATINEINTLRKHVDQVKGGGIVEMAAPAKVVSLILSDVVGDPLDIIASGPTVPDRSTYKDAMKIIDDYDLRARLPASIIKYLEAGLLGEVPETPKHEAFNFEDIQNQVIGSNYIAAKAAVEQAIIDGFHAQILTTFLQGEARIAADFLMTVLKQISISGEPIQRPACVVVGGETTVKIRGNGLGGRNQELALASVESVSELENVAIVTLATDGGDGPTDAAGAIVTDQTLEIAIKKNLNPNDYLSNNDSYHFFEELGDLLKPGPTNTNVNDLTFLFAFD
jgi:glycerate 2-kinase